jgi:hypothetical protein
MHGSPDMAAVRLDGQPASAAVEEYDGHPGRLPRESDQLHQCAPGRLSGLACNSAFGHSDITCTSPQRIAELSVAATRVEMRATTRPIKTFGQHENCTLVNSAPPTPKMAAVCHPGPYPALRTPRSAQWRLLWPGDFVLIESNQPFPSKPVLGRVTRVHASYCTIERFLFPEECAAGHPPLRHKNEVFRNNAQCENHALAEIISNRCLVLSPQEHAASFPADPLATVFVCASELTPAGFVPGETPSVTASCTS